MTQCPKLPFLPMADLPELRWYQNNAVDAIKAVPPGGTLVIQSPTQSGKSRVMAKAMADGRKHYLLTHRRILLIQLSDTLKACGIPHGIRARGFRPDLKQPIQLGMWQTENARVFRSKQWPMHECDQLHLDEPHACLGGKMAVKILDAYNMAGASLIGYTATPANIGHVFKNKFVAATVSQLIKEGFLVPPVSYTPTIPDLEKLESVKRTLNGDFDAKALDGVWNQKVMFGSIRENLLAINPELRPTVLFAPGVPHSIWTAQTLTSSGITAAHIDGKSIWYDGKETDSDQRNREKIFSLLRKGVIKVICNRFVLREGWSEPCVSHGILCPFGSLQSYIQAAGRLLGLFPGKAFASYQDHGGNAIRFPGIDTDIDWDLDAPDKELTKAHQAGMKDGKIPEPITCPKCNANRTKGSVCPLCHHRSETSTRTIVQIDGILRKQTGKIYKTKVKRVKVSSDSDVWKGLYYGNRKYYGNRTFHNIYTNYARRTGFKRFLPTDLPLMPRNPADWGKSVREVPMSDLFREKA